MEINRVLPTLFVLCGLPGSGKTTLAKKLEAEHKALRLCPDEWIEPLFGKELNESAFDACRTPVETVQWSVAARGLELGVSEIVENGVWSRQERDEFRRKAAELGARFKLIFLDVPRDELWARIQERNAHLPAGSFFVTEEQLDLFFVLFEPPTRDELVDES